MSMPARISAHSARAIRCESGHSTQPGCRSIRTSCSRLSIASVRFGFQLAQGRTSRRRPPYQADKRHVIVFCDQDGLPYTPRPAPVDPPSPTDPDAGVVEAERRLLLLSPGTGDFSFAEHGVLTFPANTGLDGTSGRVSLAMTGTHVRLGVYPHGQLGATTTVDFAPDMFLRLQVLDYRDWFRRNPNPRNRLTRYTEGNLVTPLIDGARFLRELYRMFRATYKDIDPDPAAGVVRPLRAGLPTLRPTSVSRAKLLLSNAWIDPHTPLLGRRGLIAAPKTQDVAPDDLPSFEVLMSKIRFVARGRVSRDRSTSRRRSHDQLKWWMVSEDERAAARRLASKSASWSSPTTSTATIRASPARC